MKSKASYYYEKIGDELMKLKKYYNAERAYRKSITESRIQDFNIKEYKRVQEKVMESLRKQGLV